MVTTKTFFLFLIFLRNYVIFCLIISRENHAIFHVIGFIWVFRTSWFLIEYTYFFDLRRLGNYSFFFVKLEITYFSASQYENTYFSKSIIKTTHFLDRRKKNTHVFDATLKNTHFLDRIQENTDFAVDILVHTYLSKCVRKYFFFPLYKKIPISLKIP